MKDWEDMKKAAHKVFFCLPDLKSLRPVGELRGEVAISDNREGCLKERGGVGVGPSTVKRGENLSVEFEATRRRAMSQSR